MHVTAIIAAGGRGERFGGSQPKQLLAVGGRPILERSVAAFLAHPSVDEVVVALPQTLVDDPPEYLRSAKAFPSPLAERAAVDAPKPSAKVGALQRGGRSASLSGERNKTLHIVAGGERRQDSVANAF